MNGYECRPEGCSAGGTDLSIESAAFLSVLVPFHAGLGSALPSKKVRPTPLIPVESG